MMSGVDTIEECTQSNCVIAVIIEDLGVQRGVKLEYFLILRIATKQEGENGHTLCTY